MKLNETINPQAVDSLELDKNSERELWVLLLLKGIALVIFGFLAVIWPGLTIVTLAFMFAIFLLGIGAVDIVNGFRSISSKNLWFLKIALGLVEVGLGLYLLNRGAAITTLVFLQAIGLLLILQAVIEIISAFRNELSGGMKTLMVISGFLWFIVGVWLIRYPVKAGLPFVWLLGFYGIVGGAISIAGAFSVRPSKGS